MLAQRTYTPFEAGGALEYDAATDELLPAELDPSAPAAYAARPAPPRTHDPLSFCPLHGDSPRYCGCDPTC